MSHLTQSDFTGCTQLLIEKFASEILISDFSFRGFRLEMQYNLHNSCPGLDILTETTCITAQL